MITSVVIKISQIIGEFRNGITPRSLGALQSNASCQLFGWGSHNDLTRIDEVSIVSSQLCDPNMPQIFCSIFSTNNHHSCDAILGSPVTCGDQSIVAGFLISNSTCTQRNGQFLLNYLSVSEFQRWINDPIGDTDCGVVEQLSILVFMSAVIINFM